MSRNTYRSIQCSVSPKTGAAAGLFGSVATVALLLIVCGPALADSLPVVTPCVDRIGFFERFECEIQEVAASARPSVVTIYAERVIRESHGGAQGAEGAEVHRLVNVGSGIILDSLGRIVTIAAGLSDIEDFRVELLDGRRYRAILIGKNDQIAVLQLQASNLSPAKVAESLEESPGSFVAIIGNAYGYRSGVSWGVLSGFRGDGALLLDCNSSPGNAGGAVVNRHGEVIGLLTAKISDPYILPGQRLKAIGDVPTPFVVPSRRVELPSGNSLAIPITVVIDAARQIIDRGVVDRPYVGVVVSDLESWYAEYYQADHGVVVEKVFEGSPAAANGLRRGDLITAVGPHRVKTARTFHSLLSMFRPGDVVIVDIVRGGVPLKLSLEMGRTRVAERYTGSRQPDYEASNDVSPVSTGEWTHESGKSCPTPNEAFARVGLAAKSEVLKSRHEPDSVKSDITLDSLEAAVIRQEAEVIRLRRLIDSLREANSRTAKTAREP